MNVTELVPKIAAFEGGRVRGRQRAGREKCREHARRLASGAANAVLGAFFALGFADLAATAGAEDCLDTARPDACAASGSPRRPVRCKDTVPSRRYVL